MIGWHAWSTCFGAAGAPSLGIPDLGLLALKLLAVVGGAAVGGLASGWFLSLAARFAAWKKLPPRLRTSARFVGGVASGFLVWTWVFSAGGQGGMGGSGGGFWPFGQGGGQGSGVVKEPQTHVNDKPVAGSAAPIQIQLLGGSRVSEQRFYVVDGHKPRNWNELVEFLEARKRENPAVRTIDIAIYEDSVDKQNPAVTQLLEWAKGHGFLTKLATPAGKAP